MAMARYLDALVVISAIIGVAVVFWIFEHAEVASCAR